MTLVAVPEILLHQCPIGTATGITLDASGEKAALVFQAPKAGTIDRVGFLTGGLTTGDTVDVRLETVGSDGNPSGTLWAANTNGAAAVAAASTFYEATMTAGATVDRDDLIAAVVVQGSVPGNFQIGASQLSVGGGPPYAATFTPTWNRVPTTPPAMWVRYSDGTYVCIPGVLPGIFVTTPTLSSSTTPDEVGMKITVPFACKVRGLWSFSNDASIPDLTAKLYDSGGSLLESLVVDADHVSSSSTAMKFHRFWFDTEVTLAAGDVVRATLLFTTTTAFSFPRVASLFSDSVATAYPHGGAAVGTERTDAGAWTDDTDRLYPVGLILTAVDDGAGGGGGAAPSFAFIG